MTAAQPPVLVVGIGKMGLPMARHLAAAGHAVTVFDPDHTRTAQAAALGMAVAADLRVALAAHERIVSSLPDDSALLALADVMSEVMAEAVTEVMSELPISGSRSGAIWCDTSTVSPEASARAAARAATRGVVCLRTPVSGNATMAEQAQLTVYVSGDRAAYERVEPMFACWGPRHLYLGDGEQARLAKLAVNLLIVGTSTLLAEALALGERGGLDAQLLWTVITSSAAASPIVLAKAPALRAGDFTPTFTVTQMQKDVGLILGAAQALGVPTPVTEVAAAALDRAAAAGDSDADYAVVIRSTR
jgi:3-hydroxyisobutyrate dehydrogenase-like beta-hydroxyacid dehydrogenase